MALALYIHWPFCAAKCPYCDFNSHVREQVDVARWQTAMLAELGHMAAMMPGERLASIFFGGGTPSLMPPALAAALIDAAGALFTVCEDIEITLEANPTSAEAGRFADFRAAGVNRVSLGVQSLREEDLRFLGRQHSSVEALRAVELAARLFDRYSFDLIYARPAQRAADWEAELTEALRYAGGHLSLYQLTIEPNTAFYHAYHTRRAFALPEEEKAAELFELTQQMMQEAGLPAYEISNHARPGEESRHNLAYWTGGAYLGVGPGAHGRIYTDALHLSSGRQWARTHTLKSPERWIECTERQGHGIEEMTAISPMERSSERLMTGLRLTAGVALDPPMHALLDMTKLERLIAQGFLAMEGERLRATATGLLVLNTLLAEIMLDVPQVA